MKPPTIRIELFKSKTLSDGRHPVCVTVTSKGKVVRKSVASAHKHEWDAEHHQIIRRSRKDWETVNDDIDTEYTKYRLIFNELKKKDFHPSDVFREQKIDSPLFFENALEYLEVLRAKSEGTWSNSNSRFQKIKRYAGGDFRIDSINSRWIAGFKRHCMENERGMTGGNSSNTINYALKFIRQVANYAGVKIELPKLSMKAGIRQKLTLEELVRFELVELPIGSQIWHAKNTFMLQFYFRGMRIADLMQLTWENIEGDRLVYDTSKTDHGHSIKIPSKAREILNLYSGGKYILPWIRAEYEGKKHFEEIRNRTMVINRNLKLIAEKAEIKKNITTHIARHSFAAISDVKLGGDFKAIQGMLGHRSRKQTEDYINDLRKIDELDDAADRVFG